MILAYRGTKGWADIWTDIVALDRQKQSKRLQHAKAVTDRLRATHPHGTTMAASLGGALEQDTKGHKQITFNKAPFCTMYYANVQMNCHKTGDVISVLYGHDNVYHTSVPMQQKASWNRWMKMNSTPLCCRNEGALLAVA
jgi:hypothetical protein